MSSPLISHEENPLVTVPAHLQHAAAWDLLAHVINKNPAVDEKSPLSHLEMCGDDDTQAAINSLHAEGMLPAGFVPGEPAYTIQANMGILQSPSSAPGVSIKSITTPSGTVFKCYALLPIGLKDYSPAVTAYITEASRQLSLQIIAGQRSRLDTAVLDAVAAAEGT
jgi:hypothetical protein